MTIPEKINIVTKDKDLSRIPMNKTQLSWHGIEAVIFDMDGVLVDSEPFWQQAQMAVLPRYGVPLTWQDTVRTTGIRIDLIVAMYQQRHPWSGATVTEVADEIVEQVAQLVRHQGQPLPGVQQAIVAIKAKGLRLALATSSPTLLIDATLARLGLTDAFEVICSAEALPYGKPHPQVYLNAAEGLGIIPSNCVAIEDSVTGVIAGKAASMKVVAIPEANQQQDPRFSIADLQLRSLEELQF